MTNEINDNTLKLINKNHLRLLKKVFENYMFNPPENITSEDLQEVNHLLALIEVEIIGRK